MAARDKARLLPDYRPQEGRTGPALQPPGNDLTYRFPLIVETLKGLRSRSCIIDGEAVACDENGVTSFNRVRYRRHDESIFLYAFDLIELSWRSGWTVWRTIRGNSLRPRRYRFWRGHCLEAQRLPVSLRPLTRLAQNEERWRTSREAGSGGGLGPRLRKIRRGHSSIRRRITY